MTKRQVSAVDWFIGDRVTREIYMDDGTWAREGDSCLPGPLKHGAITAKDWNHIAHRYEFAVRWDDGSESRVLAHGIDREPTTPPEQICNRKACRAPNALWWNPSTRAYYCQPCALKINDANPGLCFKLTPRSERPTP